MKPFTFLGSVVFALAFNTSVQADDCPPPRDLSKQLDPLMDAVRDAPDEGSARRISDQLWVLWATAPDSKAQEMLDRGLRHREAYDFASAYTAFDDLITYCPDYAEGYNQRAFIAYLRQDYSSALIDLDQTLTLDPDHIGALAGRAVTLMGLGDIEAGQTALREALEFNPWLPERGMLIPIPGQDI